ncbi:MAG: hypothetical protein GEU75_09525 [Dehalococcoidia bacterium]|nr:hypothetical protein [Dehalococcoidia bacterium]
MQLRRLDPLANSGPYQRLLKTAVKSFTLTETQFDRIKERRPELIIPGDEGAVVGHLIRDYLDIHYGYAEVVGFRDHFSEQFEACVSAVSREEAPRGVRLAFRDRPNRSMAEMVFWKSALEEGAEWVEMNWASVPEQPEPGIAAGDSFIVREATERDRDVIAEIDAESTGQPRLTAAGLDSLYENSRWLWVILDKGGAPAGFLSLRTEPGGWGIIDQTAMRPAVADQLREPLLRWAVAWLRNNGGRRIRKQVYMADTADLNLLRDSGFVPGETGLEYNRPVDPAELKAILEERKSHGWFISVGDWR